MSTTSFKGVGDISSPSINEVIRDNLISYIDWGFLESGAFININIPASGTNNIEKLRPVNDPRFTNGTVWEGQRKNWVWEDGLERPEQPISISGIWVNSTFLPSNSGYYIDYPNGRVVFNSPMPAASSVKVNHSVKWVSVLDANGLEDITQIQYRSFKYDSNVPVNSGNWQRLADTRVQLPAVIVHIPYGKTYEGFQLGGSQWVRMQVLIDVISEDRTTSTRLASAISQQNDSTLYVYDSERLSEAGDYPLDYRGAPQNNPLTYPELIAATGDGGYRYIDKVKDGKMFITDAEEQGTKKLNNNIWHTPVTMTVELVLNNI